MKTRLFVFLILLFAFSDSKAQYYFFNGDYYENNLLVEVGGSFGGMNAFTDLGGRRGIGKKFIKDFNIKNTRMQGGLFVGLMFKNSVGLRLEATFGKITAYDSILRKVAPTTNGRYERNLEFKSPIAEIAIMSEFHPFEMFGNYGEDRYPPEISPYIVAGVGFFRFNPQATLNGGLVDLQPLRTEGQGFVEYPRAKEYSLNQMSFPFGAGARYDISVATNIRVEIIYRFTTTDYLDDVSGKYIDPIYFANYLSGHQLNQAILLHDRHIPGAKYSTAHPDGVRGNPNNKDGYVTLNIKLGLTIGRDRR